MKSKKTYQCNKCGATGTDLKTISKGVCHKPIMKTNKLRELKTLILEIDIVSLRKLHEDLERMRNDSHPWVGMLVRQLDEGNANRIKVVIDDFGGLETFTFVKSYE